MPFPIYLRARNSQCVKCLWLHPSLRIARNFRLLTSDGNRLVALNRFLVHQVLLIFTRRCPKTYNFFAYNFDTWVMRILETIALLSRYFHHLKFLLLCLCQSHQAPAVLWVLVLPRPLRFLWLHRVLTYLLQHLFRLQRGHVRYRETWLNSMHLNLFLVAGVCGCVRSRDFWGFFLDEIGLEGDVLQTG